MHSDSDLTQCGGAGVGCGQDYFARISNWKVAVTCPAWTSHEVISISCPICDDHCEYQYPSGLELLRYAVLPPGW